MMVQYWAIKKAHPDCLLFYRMGDFYEMFFDDAVQAAAALDITLTKRGRHEGEDIPMCGVPIHNYEPYLNRLVGQGFRIAVCEQLEDPAEAKKRGGKSVVNRDVVRIFTKGTLVEDTLLDARANNFLAALAQTGGRLGLAWCDLSTGALNLQPVAGPELAHALDRLDARELLVPERLIQNPDRFELFAEWRDRMTVQPDSRFDSENGRRRLEALYQVGALAAFGNFSRAEIAAAGALVGYIDLTQKGRVPRLSPPSQVLPGSVMQIDGATRRNLELNRTLNGERRGSLLACLDRTMTAVGARLLATRLAAPLTSPEPIRERLAAVGFWLEQESLRTEMRQSLRGMPDLERALSRLALGRGGPRDLATIRDGLIRAGALKVRLGDLDPATLPPAIAESRLRLGEQTQVVDLLARALVAEPPVLARDGGFIAAGYAPALDLARATKEESRRKIALLQAKYAGEAGIASLKVRHNSVLGYHIEVTAAQADKLMTGGKATGAGFIHRQTTANSVRFSTVALGELEQALSSADSHALGLELEAFSHLVATVVARGEAIAACALGLAELDVSAALAELAAEADWCRPVVDASTAFAIAGGRHPVVEAALAAGEGGERFVPNDCNLAPDQRLWLITGPNMAGKSTYLRQNALIAVMAQIGSYVPATAAHIGVVDRLFSRVGAADDLARGRSTFMVEMLETAAILNQAGPRALVILDEIGRGTATFDGLSIAWACVEHLHEVTRCRALFATHYHELTRLAERLQALACHTMRVKEWQSEVVFLHEITAGTADRSYGIHVARLAGLPPAVIARAQEVLDLLETGDQASVLARLADDLPLFQAAAVRQATERRAAQPAAKAAAGASTSRPALGNAPSDLERALAAIDPDTLTPRDALEHLYRLRAMLGEA